MLFFTNVLFIPLIEFIEGDLFEMFTQYFLSILSD